MSKITLAPNASGTGILTVAAPNTNSNYTLTLPAETGTVLSSASSITQNAGPAFFTTIGSNQSVTINTTTKLQFNTETFDTNSNFDTSTYRFTPTVAGYYQINVCQEFSTGTGLQQVMVYKNGSRVGATGLINNSSTTVFCSTSSLVYCNGSTDYIEAYCYTNWGSTAYSGSSSQFSGALVRAA